ncbi:hypothetical protein [Actinoplanes sp. NPDC048796]|uniref:hypothetical protein n=1 Tax=Actinoplanes sp. NPDC048796 TaxID=3155640 RepID=UPI0033ED202A
MRRLVFPVIVASGLVMAGPSSAFADDPAPVVSAPSVAGKKMCKIADKRLDEVSGLVATKTGYIVVNDGTLDDTKKKIFFLNAKCAVVKEVSYSGKGPFDTEDMVLSADGSTLWIADIGDNNFDNDKTRESIALWKMPVSGASEPVLYRLTYPDAHHDAEALLLNGNGVPLIVTKEIQKQDASAYIYQPTAALKTGKTGVPMKLAAKLTVSGTQTAGNPYARIGNKTISGAAIAPGGGKVVLRTYTDALEWDVTNGDVLGAIKNKPRTTGLPNETLGEAITYSPDGKFFYTTSDMSGDKEAANYILRYAPATTVAKAAASGGEGEEKKWYADLELSDITYAVAGVGVLGLILVGVGVLGIVRFRKRAAEEPDEPVDGFDNPLDGEPETELIGVGGTPQRAGVYGGKGGPTRPSTDGANSGAVYGGAKPPSGAVPAAAGSGPGVYGGAKPARGPQGQPARGPQGQPARGPQGQPVGGAKGQPGRTPQGQPAGGPARGPQRQPASGAQGQPGRAPQGQPARGIQGQPAGGAQGQPARGPQGQPARGPQGQPARGPQGQPGRAPQGQPARGPQGQPARGPQGQPARGPEGQPARGPQGQPARGPQGQPVRGGQQPPGRGPQGQPARGPQGQPPRGPQGQPARGPQGQPGRGPQGQPPRDGQPPSRNPQGQPSRGGQQPPRGPQPPRGAQGGGVYGAGPQQGRPEPGRQRNDYARHPEGRFDNPQHGYGPGYGPR